jgi:hypothetical protein
MKMKHNKKRNTAFLFEVLSRELTKSIIRKDAARKKQTVALLREFFKKGAVLAKELELYHSLINESDIDLYTAEKLVLETKLQYAKMNKKSIFDHQSKLINKMNRAFTPKVFGNFVPNYKTMATIYQMLNADAPPKQKILFEKKVVEHLAKPVITEEKKQVPTDQLTLKTFIKKFNDAYSVTLLDEQKKLLNKFITSFSDNGIELKIYLNEELSRLKSVISESKSIGEVKSDPAMIKKMDSVLEVMKNYQKKQIDSTLIEQILKIQNLAGELNI